MNAADIAAALGNARREGACLALPMPVAFRPFSGNPRRRPWPRVGDLLGRLRAASTCSPSCDGAGCSVDAPTTRQPSFHQRASMTTQARTARALKIWRDTQHGAGTIAVRYLASRGIAPDQWPPALRFHPRCPRPKDEAGNFVSPLPAMVGLVEHVERGPVAVHCTYLQPDGSGKADIEKAKAIFGPVAGGAVRFGMPRAGEWLAVAEGIETR